MDTIETRKAAAAGAGHRVPVFALWSAGIVLMVAGAALLLAGLTRGIASPMITAGLALAVALEHGRRRHRPSH